MDEEILNNLLKRALGYNYDEVQEEFCVDEGGEIVLSKRRVTKKYCPPDGSALKFYLELTQSESVSSYSDEELAKEKLRLLKELAKSDGSESGKDFEKVLNGEAENADAEE